MFDSLALENPKRKWTTLMSFTMETAFVAALIAAPLAFTDKLPLMRVGDQLVAPTNVQVAPPTQPINRSSSQQQTSELNPDLTLIQPTVIPPTIHPIVDEAPVVPSAITIVGAPSGMGNAPNRLMETLMNGFRPRPPVTAPSVPHAPVIVSHLDEGFIIHRVQPVYPRNAIITRTEGTVVLAALIDTSGRITQLHALSGHPLLIPAAIDAVRQWRYKPYVLNGAPVEVETQINVNFYLSR